jgi:uncharacterized protein YndB with AHSA1/START domain
MAGAIFKWEVRKETGRAWEEWTVELGREVDGLWSHEQIQAYVRDQYEISEPWSEWIATMYEELMGRIPVGKTKDAGVQIGVRRTFAVAKERAWHFLTSPQGLALWIGEGADFKLRVGHEYESKEGVSGKIAVVVPYQKLRMTWKRSEWDSPSRLQLYVLATNSGKTTVAIHQEMLEDVYMRDVMKRHWEEVLGRLSSSFS